MRLLSKILNTAIISRFTKHWYVYKTYNNSRNQHCKAMLLKFNKAIVLYYFLFKNYINDDYCYRILKMIKMNVYTHNKC